MQVGLLPRVPFWKESGIDEETVLKTAAGKTVEGAIPSLSANSQVACLSRQRPGTVEVMGGIVGSALGFGWLAEQ
jgi:hypothetical protein